jgi:hypothetical protein
MRLVPQPVDGLREMMHVFGRLAQQVQSQTQGAASAYAGQRPDRLDRLL